MYVAARTSRHGPQPADGTPGTVEDTAEEVCARGGKGIAVRANLGNAEEAEALFRRVADEQGRLDLMADAAWGPTIAEWSKHFWDLSTGIWADTLATINAAWLTTAHAARIMVKQRSGVIVHVTDNIHPDDPYGRRGQILWDLGHDFLNRLVGETSRGLKKSKVAVVGLNPGFMRTERVLRHMTTDKIKRQFRFDLSESPEYIGRAAAALTADENVFRKTGQLLWVAHLAKEYGFTDIDGRVIPIFDPHAPEQPFPC